MRPKSDRGPCTAPGCGERAWARGYCRKHYNRLYRTGQLELARDDRALQARRAGALASEVRHAEQELARARADYAVAVGVAALVRFAVRIREIEQQIAGLQARRIKGGAHDA